MLARTVCKRGGLYVVTSSSFVVLEIRQCNIVFGVGVTHGVIRKSVWLGVSRTVLRKAS